MDSILNSIKKLLGIDEEYEVFDADLIMHINTVFMILAQLGVETEKHFSIESADEEWSDFTSRNDLNAIKSYIFMKVRLMFDPPQNSAILSSYERQISELEWRLNSEVDRGIES